MTDGVDVWFGKIAYDRYVPAIIHYADILLNRIAPIFDDVETEQQRVADEILSSWSYEDYETAMETAHDKSIAHAIEFMEMRSVFLATGVSGLFHLFEKQLYGHLNRELRS